MSSETPVNAFPTFSSISSIWSHDEAVKLIQADVKVQEIQNKIDGAVKGILMCPQIRESFPLLSTYKSEFRKIDPSKKQPDSEAIKELETILSAIQQGEKTMERCGCGKPC